MLKDKVAIVTGAASGIGKGIAEAYVAAGAKVIIADYNLEGAESVAEELNGQFEDSAIAFKVDVSQQDQVEAMIDEAVNKFGGLDILINNAGVMDGMEPVGEISNERWQRIYQVNVDGVMYAMRKAIEVMGEKGGSIINVASVGGIRGGAAGAAFVSSKHAVVGLSKNTAYMYAKENIRCNVIAPGGVETGIGATMTDMSEFGYGRMSMVAASATRQGQPEEIASLAVYLGSDGASFVNGTVINVDGGWTAG